MDRLILHSILNAILDKKLALGSTVQQGDFVINIMDQGVIKIILKDLVVTLHPGA